MLKERNHYDNDTAYTVKTPDRINISTGDYSRERVSDFSRERVSTDSRDYSSYLYADGRDRKAEQKARNKRRRKNQFKQSFKTIAIIPFIIIIAYAILSIINQQPYIDSKKAETVKLQQQIVEAEQKNKDLIREKSKLNTKAYKMKIAREKLGLVKKGERIFIDIDE